MSSIMRWRNGLMGLSDIAKAPVSHGVEPHDLETGPRLRVPPQSFSPSSRPSPTLPRERFRSWAGDRAFMSRENALADLSVSFSHTSTPDFLWRAPARPRPPRL